MAINILILEDDKNLGESLKTFFSQKGAEVHLAHTVHTAEHLLSFHLYNLMIVDLVMAKVTGLEFLKKAVANNKLEECDNVWCISGILNHDILPQKVWPHIDEFFKKPLDIKLMGQKFDTIFNSKQYKKYFNFFYMKEKIDFSHSDLLDSSILIEGHQLMFIYLYLCHIQFTGTLEIVGQNNNLPAKIFFKNGKIFEFKMEDKQSYLGTLLVKKILVSQKDINKLVESKGSISLGEELVKQCLISPHIIQQILKEQLTIRLSKIMNQKQVNVRYSTLTLVKKPAQNIHVSLEDLVPLLDSWVFSKVKTQWIKDFFNNHQNMVFRPLKQSSIKPHSQSKLSAFISTGSIESDTPVYKIVDNPNFQKEDYIHELYYRLLIKNCCLVERKEDTSSSSSATQNYKIIKQRMMNLLNQSKNKNYFELLNLSERSTSDEVSENYKSVVKAFHPDSIKINLPPELEALREKCFVLITKAYHTLTDPHTKQQYMMELEKKHQENACSIQLHYSQAKQSLKNGQYKEAFQILDSIIKRKEAPDDILLYWIWADMKLNSPQLSSQKKKDLSIAFMKIPIEQQQKAIYFFIKGLFMKLTGTRKEAYTLFTKALLLDPKLETARKERYLLGIVKKNKKKKSFINLFKFSA